MTPSSVLTDRWRRVGIASGDLVLVHSSLSRTLRHASQAGYPIGPEDVLKSLLDAVGPRGTVLLPLFNFGFAKGEAFDWRTTPSKMGALTECARRHPDAVRTGHPIYSFAAIGARADLFHGVDNESGYSDASPFAILRRNGGKIAVIDLPDQRSMTFYHHVEEVLEVPYRYFKTFSGDYTDAQGLHSIRSYTLFVRDLDQGVRTHVDPAGELAWERGLYRGDRPGQDSGMRVVTAQALFDLAAGLISSGRAEGTLFRRESP